MIKQNRTNKYIQDFLISNRFKVLSLFFIVTILLLLILIISYKLFLVIKNYKKKTGTSLIINLSDNMYIKKMDSPLIYYHEPKPGLFEEFSEILKSTTVYNINSDTLNSKSEYKLKKDLKNFRVNFLGDSFTFGQYVNTDNNYVSVLSGKLNSNRFCSTVDKYELINLGVAAYDIQYTIERYKRRGIKYKPDAVIWLINHWNLENINEYIYKIQDSLFNNGLSEFDKNSGEYTAAIKARGIYKSRFKEEDVLNMQNVLLKEFRNIFNGQLIILYFPIMQNTTRNMLNKIKFKDSKILYYELPDLNSKSNLTFPDGHPNEKGHREIADAIYEYITKLSVFCPN